MEKLEVAQCRAAQGQGRRKAERERETEQEGVDSKRWFEE